MSFLVFPMFNFTLWREPSKQRVVDSFGELGRILVQVIGLEILLQARIGALLYPLFLVDIMSVLLVLTIVNSMIVVILLRWENRTEGWTQALLPLSLGFLLSVAEVGGIALLRAVLGGALASPSG